MAPEVILAMDEGQYDGKVDIAKKWAYFKNYRQNKTATFKTDRQNSILHEHKVMVMEKKHLGFLAHVKTLLEM